METTARLHILVHKKTKDILISRFEKKKIGSLEGWFAHGKFNRFTYEELMQSSWTKICQVLSNTDDEPDKSDYELMKYSQSKHYKVVSLALYPDGIDISPLEKANKHGGAISKCTIKISVPVDSYIFNEQLKKAIEDAE